jgi:PKD domain
MEVSVRCTHKGRIEVTSLTRKQLRPRRYLGAVLVLLALPAAAYAQDQRPEASFSFSPEDPRAGQEVRFESSSCDPDGRLVRQAWDLDGDGAYDDAEGAAITQTFPGPGARTIGLEVTARGGATDRQRRTVMVDTIYALPRPDSDRLMSPYPVVRLAGSLTSNGARVRVLSVIRAPRCALVTVSCKGRSCPAKRARGYVGRGTLRFRQFERRLRAGAVLTVRISKNDLIGKHTVFKIRRNKAPQRRDRCLRPGERSGSPCPRD